MGSGFARLGKHISDAHSSYDDNEKRLSLMMAKVEGIMELEGEEEVGKIDTVIQPRSIGEANGA